MGDAREIAGLLRRSAALIHDGDPTVRSRLMQRAADMLDRLDNVDEQATAPAPGSRCTGTVRMIEPQPIVVTCDDPTCPEHGRCTCTHRGTPWHAENVDPFCAVHGTQAEQENSGA